MTRLFPVIATGLILFAPASALGQGVAPLDTLRTRAERSGYAETSRYTDVAAFLDALEAASPALHVTPFGTSVEGRALPLAVWGAPSATAEAVLATGKTRVLVVANIHAGEVDGKEAMLALLRDLARGAHAAWADSLVLLVAPIYNADGNERVAFDNRPLQLGPVGGMGQRPNAQGLDLNRDFMKLAAPESQALVRLLRAYDPHVVVDLHTTDGTLMAYHLTYAPALHPNTDDRLEAELWDRWLPAVTEAVESEDGWAFWHYGNVPGAFGEEAVAPRGWYSFDPRPRFGTNYAGLRNRFGILSESYSYAPFEERIRASKRFVEEVVDYAWAHASRIRRLTEQAESESVVGDTLALRATFAPLPAPVEVLLGEADTVFHPVTGAPMLQRRDVRRPEVMPAFVRFAPIEEERAPMAYAMSSDLTEVLDLLRAHGIRIVEGYGPGAYEAFQVDSVRIADQPFQGRQPQEVFGRYEVVGLCSPGQQCESLYDDRPHSYVFLDQPLGRLAFSLLEPRSDDGVVAWGVLDLSDYHAGGPYPIFRMPAPSR